MPDKDELDFIVPKKLIIGDKVIYPYQELKKLLQDAKKTVFNSIHEDCQENNNEQLKM